MTKLTKKGKLTIAVSVIVVAVLVFSITMFSIWASIDVGAKRVNYVTLQKKLGKYFIVPSGLDSDVKKTDVTDKTCRVYFPEPDEGSKHHYGKYTNLTLRYKYATGYSIDLEPQGVFASISASKGFDILYWIDEKFDAQNVNGVDVYYKRSNAESVTGGIREDMEIIFVLDSVGYEIKASSIEDDARQKVDDYARYLFDKTFIVE